MTINSFSLEICLDFVNGPSPSCQHINEQEDFLETRQPLWCGTFCTLYILGFKASADEKWLYHWCTSRLVQAPTLYGRRRRHIVVERYLIHITSHPTFDTVVYSDSVLDSDTWGWRRLPHWTAPPAIQMANHPSSESCPGCHLSRRRRK